MGQLAKIVSKLNLKNIGDWPAGVDTIKIKINQLTFYSILQQFKLMKNSFILMNQTSMFTKNK